MSTKPVLGFAQVVGPSEPALRDWLQVLREVQGKIASGKALTAGEQHDLNRIISEMEKMLSPTMVGSATQRRLPLVILGED